MSHYYLDNYPAGGAKRLQLVLWNGLRMSRLCRVMKSLVRLIIQLPEWYSSIPIKCSECYRDYVHNAPRSGALSKQVRKWFGVKIELCKRIRVGFTLSLVTRDISKTSLVKYWKVGYNLSIKLSAVLRDARVLPASQTAYNYRAAIEKIVWAWKDGSCLRSLVKTILNESMFFGAGFSFL